MSPDIHCLIVNNQQCVVSRWLVSIGNIHDLTFKLETAPTGSMWMQLLQYIPAYPSSLSWSTEAMSRLWPVWPQGWSMTAHAFDRSNAEATKSIMPLQFRLLHTTMQIWTADMRRINKRQPRRQGRAMQVSCTCAAANKLVCSATACLILCHWMANSYLCIYTSSHD